MNVQELIKKAEEKGLQFHHKASRKGYICQNNGYAEEYNGRFGEGVVLHCPSCENAKSNQYYTILYYTKQ